MTARFCQCGTPVIGGIVCSKCYRAPVELKGDRPSACRRGYDRRWRNLRKRYLDVNESCEICRNRGRYVPADEVHHKQKITDEPALRLVWSNLQSVCRECHQAIHKNESTDENDRAA